MSAGLVNRLREVGRGGEWKAGRHPSTTHPICTEAADLIEAQAAEIERLREVLADIADYGDDPDHPAVLYIADEARNALENKP